MSRCAVGFLPVALGFALLSLSGCGGDGLGRNAISGTVSFDGQPVAQGTITFEPVGAQTASGAVITGGKYAIEKDQGLPAGKYRVMVNAPKPGTGGTFKEGDLPGEELKPPEELIPPTWNTKSEQFIEVKPEGPFEFNFDIKKS